MCCYRGCLRPPRCFLAFLLGRCSTNLIFDVRIISNQHPSWQCWYSRRSKNIRAAKFIQICVTLWRTNIWRLKQGLNTRSWSERHCCGNLSDSPKRKFRLWLTRADRSVNNLKDRFIHESGLTWHSVLRIPVRIVSKQADLIHINGSAKMKLRNTKNIFIRSETRAYPSWWIRLTSQTWLNY